MAVYAAHLTRTASGAPSVFTLAAQEALGNTIKPALKKLAEYASATHPRARWTLDWFDELYLVLDTCLQYHYLKHYAASFSESFYGLSRAPLVSGEFCAGARLSSRLEAGSLLALVLLPYLRDRAEHVAERWRAQQEDGCTGKGSVARLRAALVRVHGVLHAVCAGAALVQLCRYLTGRSASHAPSLAALGLVLGEAPPPRDDPDATTWTDLATDLLKGRLASASVTFPMVGGAALRAVEYGAFVVQFLRWWDARGAQQHDALPAPHPPQRDERSMRWKNKCPLCLQPWKTPTVLPVSGYVFCYACISRHVRAHGRCPATRLPADEHALVRLYPHS